MKRWIKRSLFALVGTTVAIGGLTACARSHDAPWQMSAEKSQAFRDKMVERVASKLDLDAAQKGRLNVLADTLRAQRVAMAGSTPDPRAAVKSLVAGDKFDRTQAQKLIAEKTAALNTGSPEVIAALGDFYDSLSPAQQQKVRDFMDRGGRNRW